MAIVARAKEAYRRKKAPDKQTEAILRRIDELELALSQQNMIIEKLLIERLPADRGPEGE